MLPHYSLVANTIQIAQYMGLNNPNAEVSFVRPGAVILASTYTKTCAFKRRYSPRLLQCCRWLVSALIHICEC